MDAQFICGSDARRAQLREQKTTSVNGIDFLEVLDHEAMLLGSPRQQTLVLRLFRPWKLGPNGDGTGNCVRNLVLSGGVRRRDVHILWAYRADQVHPELSSAEQAYFSALPQPDSALIVRTDAYGDMSSYTLAIVDDAQAAPPKTPPGFDPITSTVSFSFKAECPSPFDCGPPPACEPVVTPPPSLDYLAKDYASFRRVLLDRLSVVAPDWRERSAADLGVVIVELLAYFGDYLSYYQDAVATEAYLGTARQRISARRHARLLDYVMHEGVSARAWVAFEVSAPLTLIARPKPPALPPKLYTHFYDSVYVDVGDPRVKAKLDAAQPLVFEPLHDAPLIPSHNRISFYTWQDDDCCLPKGATRATLSEGSDRLLLIAGDVLIFEEVLGGANKDAPDADPKRRQAVRLVSVTPSAVPASDAPGATRTPGVQVTDPLTGVGVVEIEWHADDALRFPFCISSAVPGKTTTAKDCSVARGNVILCDHGASAVEKLAPPPVPGQPRYRPLLQRAELSQAVPFDLTSLRPAPDGTPPISATASFAQDPQAATPQIALVDDAANEWEVKPDLLESDKFARDFVVEMDDAGFGQLRFGDGTLGEPPAAPLTATYRAGRGAVGNVGAEAIAHIDVKDDGFLRIRNPLSAAGGVDAEPIDEVKLYAPEAFRVQERAVTEADYAAIAERFAGVARAVGTRRWTGSWYTVFVSVERRGGVALDTRFRHQLGEFLERYRMAGEDLELEDPIYVPLDINLVICVKSGYFVAHVEKALYEAFDDRDHADGTRGFFHPDNFTFAQPVYLSQVIARAMQVAGVGFVDTTAGDFRFQRFGQKANGEIADGLIAMGRLEIARLENSLSQPENGQIGFSLMGGQ